MAGHRVTDESETDPEVLPRLRLTPEPAEAHAAYLDSGAWRALLDTPGETDGIAVDDGRVVVLSRAELTPERIEALTDVARRFIAGAAGAGAGEGAHADPRLADPLTTH